MKILVYSDVHGNKYALEVLQKTEDYKNADLRIFLGDVFAMCPYPYECMSMIWNNDDIFLLGNHDSYCAYGLPKEEFMYFNKSKQEHQKYMRDKIPKEFKEKLKTLPKEYFVEVEGKKFYFVHFPWEADRFVFDDPDEPAPATEKTGKLFNNVDADYIFFGHNHKPSDFKYSNKTFTCVGSLGMCNPGNYVVVEINNGKVDIIRKYVNFDVDKLKREMKEENYPRALIYSEWFN